MNNPLDYRDPAVEDSSLRRRRRARQTMTVGIIVFAVCLPLLFSPILLGAKLGKFVAAPAFVGGCWGLSCLLHGGWDWWRGRSA
jgi:hypothetical protein